MWDLALGDGRDQSWFWFQNCPVIFLKGDLASVWIGEQELGKQKDISQKKGKNSVA